MPGALPEKATLNSTRPRLAWKQERAGISPGRRLLTYARLVAVTWSMAYAVGPIIGGAFAQSGLWRWYFWSSYSGRDATPVKS